MKLGMTYPGTLGGDIASIGACASAGATGILVKPELLVDDSFSFIVEPDEFLGAVSAAGLETCGWTAASKPLVQADGGTDGREYVYQVIDLADALRDVNSPSALPIVVVNPGNAEDLSGIDANEAWDSCVAALKELSDYATERQVLVAVLPERDSIVDRSRKALKILQEVASGYVQVCFDPAGTLGKDQIDSSAKKLKNNAVVVIARDVKFDDAGKPTYSAPGDGMMNYEMFFELMADAPALEYVVIDGGSSAEEVNTAAAMIKKLMPA